MQKAIFIHVRTLSGISMADTENSLGININRVIKEQKVVTNDWKWPI